MSIVGSEQWMYASGGEAVAQQSLKFNDDESQYLSWTPATAGNRKTWTWSGWVKKSFSSTTDTVLFSANNGGNQWFLIGFSGGNAGIDVDWYNGSTRLARKYSNAKYRDVSAWYNVVVAVDTTDATAEDRIKVYINGVRITSWSSNTNPSQNSDTYINSTNLHTVGKNASTSQSNYFDGYLSDIHFIDGQALDPTSFGQFTNGYWEKKDYAGSYGTNGFHLTFADDVVSEGFNAVTYKGIGTKQSISGLGFSPDLVWGKQRSGANSHEIYDTVRGAQQILYSDLTDAEGANINGVSSFDADGYTVAGNTSINLTGNSVVAWAWDAGENNAPTGHSSVTYTGNGGTQSIKGMGFEPDLVWIKSRSNADPHELIDTVRGSTQRLRPNSTNAESTVSTDGFVSFDADGFSLDGAGGGGQVNGSGRTYVAWGWDAGNGSPVSNTDGSITSTVKANPATGFSVVSYTGAGATGTVGHSLSSAPELYIIKNRSNAADWNVYTTVIDGSLDFLNLNSTNSALNSSISSPTSSTFGVTSATTVGASGNNYIAYCFHSVAGYSDIGSYTGTGASGNAINCGFRPGFVMVKDANSGTAQWVIVDATRNPLNPISKKLAPNSSVAENDSSLGNDTQNLFDFTDTGFTLTTGNGNTNLNGGNFIYMAFKGSYADYVSDVNTDGTIDSRVKTNPDYGFSVVSYSPSGSSGSVGHGLGVTPDAVIVKRRDAAGNWVSHWPAISGTNKQLYLNLTNAVDTNNISSLTSTTFSVSGWSDVATAGGSYVAYCFNSVAGYSSIGSYTGNGSASGPTVTTNFNPALLLVKRTDTTGNWFIWDNTRDTDGVFNTNIHPNSSVAEAASGSNFVTPSSTGFQLTGTGAETNASGGTYIYMAFADTREAAFWKDVSGQGNHWTPNNLDYRDSLVDSPANNFATLNPLDNLGASMTLSEGNLKVVCSGGGGRSAYSNFYMDSGSWYIEAIGVENSIQIGGVNGSPYFRYNGSGTYSNNGTIISGKATYTNTDIVAVAYNADTQEIEFFKNNSSQGSVTFSAAAGVSVNFCFNGTASQTDTMIANFGQDSTFAGAKPMGAYTDDNDIGNFQYAPPAGYLALCTANLPTPTIIDGSTAFNTTLWAGNGVTGRAITGVGHQPDFLWVKGRNLAISHYLQDSVRGATKYLYSDGTNAEGSTDDTVDSFDSDGFTLGNDGGTNASGYNYVGWSWKAGGAAVSNTDGSITSQVSANTTAGFSIVSYTGTGSVATIGHGLNSPLDMFIIKNRDRAENWPVYARPAGNGGLFLDGTNSYSSSSSFTNNTDPTGGVFTIGTNAALNVNGEDCIAYCFHSVEGFSKVGSYTGNGTNQFIYTGFRPAFVLAKATSAADNWRMYDSARIGYNPNNSVLYPSFSNAEDSTTNHIDLLSNGFRWMSDNNNANGHTFIYLAFAEHPFKYANAR